MSTADHLAEWLPLVWSLLGIALLWWLVKSGIAGGLLRRVSKFGGFGLAFEFSEATAQQTREKIEPQLAAVRSTIQRELAADVRARGLDSALKSVLEDPTVNLSTAKDLRATVHIPDPLFENQLFQLLDYYPKGAGSGRTFSTRSGIIGLVWRTSANQQWFQDAAITTPELIREWGMTPREAADRTSADVAKDMLAIPLKDPTKAVLVGVMYLDSKLQNAFGTGIDQAAKEAARDDLMNRIDDSYQRLMAKPLAELVEAAKRNSPQLDLESS